MPPSRGKQYAAVDAADATGMRRNVMYVGVLAVGIVGAIIARLRPDGMARALLATAVAQGLVAVIALIAGLGSTGAIWPRDILISTGFFAPCSSDRPCSFDAQRSSILAWTHGHRSSRTPAVSHGAPRLIERLAAHEPELRLAA